MRKEITYKGATRTAADWSRLTGIGADTIIKRLNAGWSVEDALLKPVGKQGHKSPLAQSMPALHDWQHDMHAGHRELSRTIRSFVRSVEEQMAELRHGLDQRLAEQRERACRGALAAHSRGVVENFTKQPNDRCSRVTQESR